MNIWNWQNNMLFRGMSEGEFRACLDALSARVRRYEKGTVILRAGDRTERMGIVLSGGVTVETNDAWGNRTILSHVGAGGFFAETFAYLDDLVLRVDVAASEDSEAMNATRALNASASRMMRTGMANPEGSEIFHEGAPIT